MLSCRAVRPGRASASAGTMMIATTTWLIAKTTLVAVLASLVMGSAKDAMSPAIASAKRSPVGNPPRTRNANARNCGGRTASSMRAARTWRRSGRSPGAWIPWTARRALASARARAEHRPRLALQQYVRPAETLQHQTWAAVAAHDVDQPRGDAVTVQVRQCHRLRTVPEVSGTVELDDRVVTPRVYLGLAALASLGSDHSSASGGRPVSQSVTGLRARTRSTVPALSRSASTMSNPAARTSGSCRRVKCSPAARMVSHSRSHCAA